MLPWLVALVLLCCASFAVPIAAAAEDRKVSTQLVAEVAAIRPGEPFWVALHQRITPGWHTYWRNPGDSGEPATLAWRLPKGFTADEIAWPVPERLPVGPAMSFGFTNEILLPVRITPPADLRPGERVALSADASWLVCADICIPEESPVLLTLPVVAGAPPADARWGPVLAAARAALPRPSPWPATFSASADTVTLTVAAPGLR
ncbi:MAG TPA: protein-disulfide reductase DsbD domain-containing protein, partial [Terriglobales bacterium]|nr:protein-disulfide reductase DsbD domain-containing protein [Terriglobales bacterium]